MNCIELNKIGLKLRVFSGLIEKKPQTKKLQQNDQKMNLNIEGTVKNNDMYNKKF